MLDFALTIVELNHIAQLMYIAIKDKYIRLNLSILDIFD